jgi:NAD(P)-dependent dehydrogenase (short-subunit alcohol dehydrogenase family)
VNVMSAGGCIVLVSSTAGQRGEAYHSDYAATKGAIISFTKSLCRTRMGRYRYGTRGDCRLWKIAHRVLYPPWTDRNCRGRRGSDRFPLFVSGSPCHWRSFERERRQRSLRIGRVGRHSCAPRSLFHY